MKPEDITKLIPEQLQEHLSAESLSAIQAEFEKLVESTVNDRVGLAIKSAESNFDAEVNEKLVNLVNKIDEAHKIGLKKVVQKLKENYNNKIRLVRNYYNRQIVNESKKFQNGLVENLSKFLDTNIDKALPKKELKKAVQNTSAFKVLESFKTILSVNEASVNEAIKQPLAEGMEAIKIGAKQRKKLRKQNDELLQENNELKRNLLIEEKIQGLNEDAKNHLRRVLTGADDKFINENFDYALKLYKQKQITQREALAESTKNKRYKKQLNESKSGRTTQVDRKRLVTPNKAKQLNEASDLIMDWIENDEF